MRKSCFLGFTLLILIYPAVFAAGLRAPERGFVSTTAAENWEEALISGNGKIGVLVLSRPLNETIIFSHERLFMPIEPSQPVVNMAPHL
ncbi:MAG: glycoside hydrolase N-terminal domain-containing protein, partial [Planctomycetota bacterium]